MKRISAALLIAAIAIGAHAEPSKIDQTMQLAQAITPEMYAEYVRNAKPKESTPPVTVEATDGGAMLKWSPLHTSTWGWKTWTPVSLIGGAATYLIGDLVVKELEGSDKSSAPDVHNHYGNTYTAGGDVNVNSHNSPTVAAKEE